jgi:exodeoxyribonuclease X
MSAYIFDTETTGVVNAVMIEAAWLKMDTPSNLGVLDQFEQRYNPGKSIDLGAMATHHIMDEDLVGCPPASEFALPSDCEYLIGHNIDFDWRVIGEPQIKRICTLALCRRFFPDADSHSQSAMIYFLERARARDLVRNAHSALADVQNCRTVLRHVLSKVDALTDSATWEFVWSLSEAARTPTVMTFGKHKGMHIDQLPSDYKQWLLSKADINPYLAKALRASGR